MIISCEKCDTKYRLDSSRISYASVKVQCSKCDHIFIVPAAGEERNKRGLENKAPDENNPAQGEERAPADEGGSGPEQPDTTDEPTEAPPEREEPADEAYKKTYPAKEEGTEAGDSSFGAEAAEPRPTPSGTGARDIEQETQKDESAPAYKPWAGLEPQETPAHEPAEANPEHEEPADEKNNDAPLPWEVSANTFDLSFGAKGHKPWGEADSSSVNDDGAPKEGAPLVDLNGGDAGPSDNNGHKGEGGEGGEDVESLPERESNDFDIKGSPEEADEGAAPFKMEGDDLFSFSEEIPKASSNGDKAPDESGENKESAQANHTFVIPDTPAEPEEAKKSSLAGVIAIIVIVLAIAGSLMYMKTRPDNTFMADPSGEKPLEIESTKGYYVVNKDGGKIFVIETMIKNITDGPVKISGIRGLVMDSSGREMARKMVSPGRVVTNEDLRNLPVETLLKSFRDTSAGTMPKKATIPTMILFTDLQNAVAEYGIDVLR